MSNSCEVCPGRGTEAFDKICSDSGFGPEGQDIDECKTLPNLCENGQCINTLGKTFFQINPSTYYSINKRDFNYFRILSVHMQ